MYWVRERGSKRKKSDILNEMRETRGNGEMQTLVTNSRFRSLRVEMLPSAMAVRGKRPRKGKHFTCTGINMTENISAISTKINAWVPYI